MRCEEARSSLFDFADGMLSAAQRDQLTEHLDSCPDCARDYEAISDLALQASVWHELPAPRWQPPRVGSPLNLAAFQQWFPSLASAAALILVIGMYLQMPEFQVRSTATVAPQSVSDVTAAPAPGMMNTSLDTALNNNRQERQQELQALVALMRAEMDRRSEETEESLRYVIAHQIQGQREIDDLYRYIRKVSSMPASGSADQPVIGRAPADRMSVNRVSADKVPVEHKPVDVREQMQ